MSAAPSEPEKYSIDEMMDRLKTNPSENPDEGELVTRSDGSQAIRVRKRKRRSSQPHKEENHRARRARIVQVSAALVLVFVAALAIGGALVYANSSPFRKGVVQKIEQASGAEVELQQFRMNPKTANAGKFVLKWPEGNILKRAALRSFRAEISSSTFFGKVLTGEEVFFDYGVLDLQVPKPGQPLRKFPAHGGDLPVYFNHYRVPWFDITLGDPASPVIKLLKTEASLSPRNVNGLPQLSLYRGDLAIAGWPNLRLDRAFVDIRGTELDIVLRVLQEPDDRGSLEFSGTISPYQPDQLSTLSVKADSFPLSGIAGPAMGRLIAGLVDTLPSAKSNYFSFLPTEKPAAKLDLAFRASPISKIEVQGFPFLFALSQILHNDTWFETPVFEGDVGGVFHRENDVVTIRDLDLQSKGRLALRGEISMSATQSLSGSLRVGLAEAMIADAPTTRLKSMFGPPEEGFRWIILKISGTATAPLDNFKELFTSTALTPLESPAPDAGEGSTFEELTRPK